MKKNRSLAFYVFMVFFFAVSIYFLVQKGKDLEKNSTGVSISPFTPVKVNADQTPMYKDAVVQRLQQSLPLLLFQIVVIVLVSRLFGMLFKRFGQPAVIGEIVAGIVLGPSLLGLFFPAVSGFLFPASSLGSLQFLSQLGLILFMFVIGMELDLDIIGKQALEAVVISHASIIFPYSLGMVLSYFLFSQFAPPQVPFLSFSLFMGIAMSITAFPVLARIIQERKMTGSKLGNMAITCAAADDVTAWCILAVLVAMIKAGAGASALFIIALVAVYSFFMFFVVKRILKGLYEYANKKTLGRSMMALVFIVLLLSAYTTEVIGIHALFGAFVAGIIMPQDLAFRKRVMDKIEDVSIVLLLPLFFVITGLRTQINLLNESSLWVAFGWILLVAVLGKFGGSALAARVVGQSWQDSLSIGALMNTRGLMELIVLNIGFDLGILPPQIFSMMVLMALITTFMTNPALNAIEWLFRKKQPYT